MKKMSINYIVLMLIFVEWNGDGSVNAAISKYVTVPTPKSIYKNFCEEDLIYKPYIKTYKGRREAVRTGEADKTYGPGFHKQFLAPEMENTYVCINGLAWLYYSVTTRKATIYQTPRLHKFVHHCFMANGVPGPGPHEEFKSLLAVLLVGNKKDYRKPSAQLFPAPYKNTTVKEEDATSVFVIGVDTECILMKGEPPTEFRVRNDNGATFPPVPPYKLRRRRFTNEDIDDYSYSPWKREDPAAKKVRLEKEATTVFCKLSYTNLENNLNDPTSVPLAFQLLKNTPPIKLKGCWRPENYTKEFSDYCETQTTIYKDIGASTGTWGQLYKELTEMEQYQKDLGVDDINIIKAETCPTAADCEEAKLQAAIDAEIVNMNGKTVAENTTIWMDKILPIMLKNYGSRLFKAVELMKTAVKAAEDAYTKAKTDIDTALVDKAKVDTAMEALVVAQKEAKAAAAGGTRDPAKDAAVVKAQEDLTDAELAYIKLSQISQASMSAAETANQTVNALLMKGFVKKEYTEYVKAYKKAAAKTKIPLVPVGLDPTPVSVTLTIKMPPTEPEELQEDPDEDDKTAFEKDKAAQKTCGRLPSPQDTCKAGTPEKERACKLLKAKMNRKAEGSGEWKSEDEWRQELIDLVSDIFVRMTPPGTIPNPKGYVNSLNSIVKAYLTNYVPRLGTAPPGPPGPPAPVPPAPGPPAPGPPVPGTSTSSTTTTTTAPVGRRRRRDVDLYDNSEEEYTRVKRQAPNEPALNPRRPFYDQIMVALVGCKEKGIVLQFDRTDERVVLLKKVGKQVKRLLVEENFEQADDEYVFNWAIDNMFFMFTSVLGVCMPSYEYSIPLISSKFYTYYTEDFLYPVAKEWVNNRDNQILRLILGQWYKSPWPKRIMEASFVHSGDLRYRPPRKLYVNDLTEGNFFTEGPLKGTAGIYDA